MDLNQGFIIAFVYKGSNSKESMLEEDEKIIT